MRPAWVLAALLLGTTVSRASAAGLLDVRYADPPREGAAFRVHVHAFAASDYTAVSEFSGTWSTYSPRGGANLSMASARIEAEFTFSDWNVGYFRRGEMLVKSNRQTTDLYYVQDVGNQPPAGQTIPIALTATGFEAKGWRIGRSVRLASETAHPIDISANVSLLQGGRVRLADTQGVVATPVASGVYTFDVTLLDSDSNKTYRFITDEPQSGRGFSFDLAAKIQLAENWQLDVAAADLGGRIHWRNIPTTESVASSATATVGADGYINFAPALRGVNQRRDFSQRLPVKAQAKVSFERGALTVGLGAGWISQQWFPELAVRYRLGPQWHVTGSYDQRFKTISVGAGSSGFQIQLRSSGLDLGRARAYGLNGSWTYRFD